MAVEEADEEEEDGGTGRRPRGGEYAKVTPGAREAGTCKAAAISAAEATAAAAVPAAAAQRQPQHSSYDSTRGTASNTASTSALERTWKRVDACMFSSTLTSL